MEGFRSPDVGGCPAAEESPAKRAGAGGADLIFGFIVLLCFAPVILRYSPPLQPQWDEAFFLGRAVCVNNAVAAVDAKGFVACFEQVKRPPLMALVALPFGGLASSPTGLGLVPVSSCILQWIIAVAIVVLLYALRVPRWMAIGVAATLALTAPITIHAGRLLGDVPFALTVALTLLLVPLEARAGERAGYRADVLRGLLWGVAFSFGLLGKMTFLVFAAVVGSAMVVLRWRTRGARSVLTTVAVALLAASPAIALTALCWKNLMAHAQLAAFGSYAQLYSSGMKPLRYLVSVASSVPLLTTVSVLLAAALPLAFRLRRRAALASVPGIFAVCLYEAMALASPNQDPRFQLPTLIALPLAFIVPWARLDDDRATTCWRDVLAWLAAGLLLVIPMSASYDFSNILDQAQIFRGLPPSPGKWRVLLATDSPMLDIDTLDAALEIVPGGRTRASIDTVVYDEADGRDLAFSLRSRVALADYMVVQSDPAKLWPEWTNRNAEEFRRVARMKGHLVPELSTKDFEVYAMRMSP